MHQHVDPGPDPEDLRIKEYEDFHKAVEMFQREIEVMLRLVMIVTGLGRFFRRIGRIIAG